MNRPHAVIWSVLGLVAGALGWAAGALVGSNMGRTVLAATLTAVALGLLARRPRLALLSGLATAAAASFAFLVGRTTITPLIAWPVAGLVIGLSSLALLQRTRARVAAVVATPLLGSLGFVLGMMATVFAGMAANDPVLVGQFLWGGAAGFGLLTIATIRVLGARLERVPASTGGAS
jgi:hypothetical protein